MISASLAAESAASVRLHGVTAGAAEPHHPLLKPPSLTGTRTGPKPPQPCRYPDRPEAPPSLTGTRSIQLSCPPLFSAPFNHTGDDRVVIRALIRLVSAQGDIKVRLCRSGSWRTDAACTWESQLPVGACSLHQGGLLRGRQRGLDGGRLRLLLRPELRALNGPFRH